MTLVTLSEADDRHGRAGWYSGSTHMHMNYGGNLHNTLENLMLMSAAEDQDVVNELIANKDNRVLDYQFFVPGGGAHPISKPDRLVIVGQEYRPPFYGHVILLGLRDHLISPWPDRLRRHRHREPLPEQHRHAAQGEGAERDDRLCALVRRRQRSAPVGGSRAGQRLHRRRRAEDRDGIEWSFSGRAPFFPGTPC